MNNSQPTSGIRKRPLIIGGALWIAVFAGLYSIWREASEAPDTELAEVEASISDPQSRLVAVPPQPLPDFEMLEVQGGTVSLSDLKGERWVACFVFSSCTKTCPTITSAMQRLHDKLRASAPDVTLVSITVDPKRDTPEVFGRYAEAYTKGDHSRWKFLTSSKEEMERLVVDGFGLSMPVQIESRLPAIDIAHSNRVVLVNEDGIPVGTYLGTIAEDMTQLTRILTGKEEFPTPSNNLRVTTEDGTAVNVQLQAVPVEDADDLQNDQEKSE